MTQPATCGIADTPTRTLPDAMKPSSVPSMATARRSVPARETKTVRKMNALERLIRRRKEELGLTWQELATRGGFSSHTILYMQATKKEHKRPPRTDTIERIAKAIDVPEDVVRQAAMEAAGYNVQEISATLEASEDVRIIAAVAGELSPRDRAMLRNIAEQFAKDMRERRDRDD
jgi:transcriptional regulator with XRE-family HTH domain